MLGYFFFVHPLFFKKFSFVVFNLFKEFWPSNVYLTFSVSNTFIRFSWVNYALGGIQYLRGQDEGWRGPTRVGGVKNVHSHSGGRGGGRQNGKILSTWLLNAPYVKKKTTISCHSLLNHIGQAIDLLILLDVDHAY